MRIYFNTFTKNFKNCTILLLDSYYSYDNFRILNIVFLITAMGPILPQLSVYGKEMGVSPVVMGSVTGILPLAFLIAKPIFGIIVDVYRDYRKAIFLSIIITMSLSYALLYFIPSRTIHSYDLTMECSQLDTCNVTVSKL